MNENIMRAAGFGEVVDKVKAGNCPFCSKPVELDTFRDELSLKEFKISGMCQKCQDSFFDPEE
jgi:hypothetical protein